MAEDRTAFDRYRKLRPLGEGGGGRVWLVEDTLRPGFTVALKELAGHSRGKEESLRREFATLASLRHPNLVEVHDFDVDPETGLARFALEYIDGSDVLAAARDGPDLLLELAAEALRALSFLHDFGLIHRDLKPANLLVRNKQLNGGRLVVLDFGLALQSNAPTERTSTAGTLPYVAPELFEGSSASRRSDLYSMGALFYEAVHGRPPFQPDGNDLSRFIEKVRQGRRSRPALPEGHPPGLHGWLEELLSPDPAGRPASASEALARLNAACGTRFPIETEATRAARLASGPPPGRENELARLAEALEPGSASRWVWLSGDAGSGKTRVLRWAASEAVRQGWEVITRVRLAPSEPRQGHVERILADLEQLATRSPVLVLLDEVETEGSWVAQFMERFLENEAFNFKVVAALRPAEVQHPTIRRLLADTGFVPGLNKLDLAPLQSLAIRKVVERLGGGAAITNQRVDWLLEASEGTPLLVEALLVQGAWEKQGRIERSATLERSIEARLEPLSPRDRRWLEALVVLGRDAAGPVLSNLAGLNPSDTEIAAQEVERVRLAAREDDAWSPASRLVGFKVLESMDAPGRQALHRRAAVLVEEAGRASPEPERLARLWFGAGDQEKSIDWAIRAAEIAGGEGDHASAADWYRFALVQLDRRDARRRSLRSRHAEALHRSGQYDHAARALATVRRLSKSREEEADALVRLSRSLTLSGRFERGLRVAERARALAETADLSQEHGRACLALGLASFRLGQDDQAIKLALQAARELAAVGDIASEAEALLVAGASESRIRRLEEAGKHLHQALERATLCEEVQLEASILIALGDLEKRCCHWDAALRWHERARAHIEEHRLRAQQAPLLTNMADLLLWAGRLDRALVCAREAESEAMHQGRRNHYLIARAVRGDALIQAGRPVEAAALIAETLMGSQTGFGVAFIDFARLTLAEALLEGPEPPESRIKDLIEQVLQHRGQNPQVAAAALVIDMERKVRPNYSEPFEPARAAYQEFQGQSSDEIDLRLQVRTHLVAAQAYLEAANLVEAVEAAATAARLAEASDLPALAARAEALLAEAYQRQGEQEKADAALVEGQQLLELAASRIEDPDLRRDFLDRPIFRTLRQAARAGRSDGQERLLAIYQMIHALNSETDPDAVLESMLDMALRVVRAERGMILLRSGPDREYSVRLARNLEQETIGDAEQFSRSVVLQGGSGRAVLADTVSDERLRELKSVSKYGIRSVLCVPLRSREEIVGAVYLDNRKEGGLFTDDDLRFLEAFANHAALALENARARRDLEQENQRLQVVAETRAGFDSIVGRSPAMQRVYDLIGKVAEANLSVLIQGESGTGKELVARAIHFNSARRRKPFLSENCAAIPESLLESALFGHVKGAFTSADRDRQGLFEQADGGTLFLDEVGDMSPGMQARLLRVLQEGELRRVGGSHIIKVDVRVLGATNRDLQREVAAGRFREDLFYRLQVFLIQLPPLRERPGDVSLLVDHLLKKIGQDRGRPAPALGRGVLSLLEQYLWPGNVRQLENTLHKLVVLAGERPITAELIQSDYGLNQMLLGEGPTAVATFSLQQNERDQIRSALQAASGNRALAARLLGISRATIFRKIKEYRLS